MDFKNTVMIEIFMCYRLYMVKWKEQVLWRFFDQIYDNRMLPEILLHIFKKQMITKTKEIVNLMFIGPCIIVTVEEWKTNLMSLAILFHFLCAQHVSDINISIIRSLHLCCLITTSVVLFSVRCVLDLWCGWFSVVSVLQAEAVLQPATRALLYINVRNMLSA